MATAAKNKTKKGPKPQKKPALFAGRYEIERKLGKGGGGEVFLARDLHHASKPVALKVVTLKKNRDPTTVEALKNEFSTLTHLHHLHLARVLDFGSTEEEIFFTSEWVDGTELLNITQGADLNTVFKLLVEVMRAVDYLHRRGVLHLDLKPANILVTNANRTGNLSVKLIDFGLAKWNKQERTLETESSGTPPYAAPEVLLQQGSTPASDIYSLGMLFHLLFAGRFPFCSQDPFEIMNEQIYGEAQSPSQIHPALPESFKPILERMVKKNPADRFQSLIELLEALNQSLDEHFTLRGATAPLHILEESDYFFRSSLLKTWTEYFASPPAEPRFLLGPAGIGKSRLLRRLKEVLQLQGVDVVLLKGEKSVRNFFQNKKPCFGPLFLEDWSFTPQEEKDLEEYCRKYAQPALVSSCSFPSNTIPTKWVSEIPTMEENQVRHFLREEIVEFPDEQLGPSLSTLTRGLPSLFEELLQALREEGDIQWTDHGWRWVGGASVDLEGLLHRRGERWEKLKRRALEILSYAPHGLEAATLEGMLGLEAGALRDHFSEWQASLATTATASVVEFQSTVSSETHWLEGELLRLYEQDEFEAGAQWARSLAKSPEAKIYGARHLIALGCNEEAQSILPTKIPEQMSLQGLYQEIRARLFLYQNKPTESLETIQTARQSYERVSDFSGISRCFNLIGLLHKRNFDYPASEAAFQDAEAAAMRGSDLYLESVALMNLGTLHQDQGRFDQASHSYRQSLEILGESSHRRHRANLKHNWINLLYHMGRTSEAEQTCYEFLDLSIKNRFVENQAAALNYLALLAGKKKNQELQLKYFQQALSILQKEKTPHFVAQLLINRGYVYASLEKYVPAQLDAEEAAALNERHPHPYLHSMALLLKGKVLRDRPKPDFKGSEEMLNLAENLVTQSQNRQLQMEAHFELGLLHKQAGRRDQARHFFEKTRTELEQLMKELPEPLKGNFLRDRKLERLQMELETL